MHQDLASRPAYLQPARASASSCCSLQISHVGVGAQVTFNWGWTVVENEMRRSSYHMSIQWLELMPISYFWCPAGPHHQTKVASFCSMHSTSSNNQILQTGSSSGPPLFGFVGEPANASLASQSRAGLTGVAQRRAVLAPSGL